MAELTAPFARSYSHLNRIYIIGSCMLNKNFVKIETNIFFFISRQNEIIDILLFVLEFLFHLYTIIHSRRVHIVEVLYRPDIKETVASGFCSVLYIVRHGDVSFFIRSKRCLPRLRWCCSFQLRIGRL